MRGDNTGVTDSGDAQPEAPAPTRAVFAAASARLDAAAAGVVQRLAAMQTERLVGLQPPALQSGDDETDEAPDETDATPTEPPQPGPWMDRFDTTYWHAQAETAIRALEQALDTLARVEAERDAAVQQLASVKRQLAQTSDTLHAERRAATQRRRSHLD